jgi:hypothetical protein
MRPGIAISFRLRSAVTVLRSRTRPPPTVSCRSIVESAPSTARTMPSSVAKGLEAADLEQGLTHHARPLRGSRVSRSPSPTKLMVTGERSGAQKRPMRGDVG